MNYIDTQDLDNYSIKALDGKIGHVSDFAFDEDLFYLRHFVVNTESFLLKNLVLISPISIININTKKKIIEVSLTKEEIESSPTLKSVEVIPQQFDRAYNDHFSWPYYWSYGILWKDNDSLYNEEINKKNITNQVSKEKSNNLRSSEEICSYSVSGSDKEFGHIQGFLLDPKTLSIDFLIINTINYIPSKFILLRPEWIKNISWRSSTVKFPLTKELIKSAPAYIKGEVDSKFIITLDKHFSKVIDETSTQFETKDDMKSVSIKNRREDHKKFIDRKSVVGHIPSGLFIVTVQENEGQEAEGFLASWVQQASFEPLLVSLCIKDGRPGIEAILNKTPFCINVVGQDNNYLRLFTNRENKSDNPLSKIPYTKISGKGIVVNGAKSAMICKAHEVSHPGDHYLITAEVTEGIIINSQSSSKTYVRAEGSHY